MSNPRRICVCGREKGNKQPVIITITTCRKNHPPNGDGSVCITSGPQATSSPIQISGIPKNTTSGPDQTQKNESTNKEDDQLKEIYDESEVIVANTQPETIASPQPDGTLYETANQSEIGTLYETANKTRSVTLNETANETLYKTANESNNTQPAETTTGTNPPANDTQHAETTTESNASDNNTDQSLYQSATENVDDTDAEINTTTAMFHTIPYKIPFKVANASINTTPFLDNLFRSKSTAKVIISEPRLKNQQDDCNIELFVFERHPLNCRHQSNESNTNFFHDGNFVFESIGRISVPTSSPEDRPKRKKSAHQSLSEHLTSYDDPYNVDLRTAARRRKELFENIENFVRNKQYQENVYKKLPQADPMLPKLITMPKDVKTTTSSSNTDEELVKKDTSERGVQYSNYIIKDDLKNSKWYDSFLMCFGMRSQINLHEGYDRNIPKREVLLKNSSAYIITQYLKV